MIKICALKKKKKLNKKNHQFDSQWKVPNLVAFREIPMLRGPWGSIFACCAMERSKFDSSWIFSCLVTIGFFHVC